MESLLPVPRTTSGNVHNEASVMSDPASVALRHFVDLSAPKIERALMLDAFTALVVVRTPPPSLGQESVAAT